MAEEQRKDPAETREANSLVRSCQRGSRAVLQDVIDTSETPRKAIAYAVLERDDEPQFSKMVGGTRPFDLDHIDKLPRPMRIEWLRQRAHAEGLEVRDPDVVAAAYQMLAIVEQLVHAARLMRLPERAEHMAPYRGDERRQRKVG
jgi:hypothetical protein